MSVLVTTEESLVQKLVDSRSDGVKHCLIQFSAPWCQRCPAFTKAIEGRLDKYKFAWLLAELPEAEELKETYAIAKLPAIVVLSTFSTSSDADNLVDFAKSLAVHQAASESTLEESLSQHWERCPLAFDEDF